MRVGSIVATGRAPSTHARSEPVTPPAPVDPDRPELDARRLSAVVELIRTLTGREVKLVPPAAYFVSPPSVDASSGPERSTPKTTPELVVAARLDSDALGGRADDALEVDISSILRDGTSGRMVLGESPAGGLTLFRGLDVEL